MAPQATISQIIEPFGLPPKLVHLVLVNGRYIEPEKRLTTTLARGRRAGHLAADCRRLNRCSRITPRLSSATWAAPKPNGWAGCPPRWATTPGSASGPSVQARIGPGSLRIDWRPAAPRVLGSARIPRLLVRFAFAGLDDGQRHAFMKRFDVYMQRGGG